LTEERFVHIAPVRIGAEFDVAEAKFLNIQDSTVIGFFKNYADRVPSASSNRTTWKGAPHMPLRREATSVTLIFGV
jgi:hypothetical protein